MGVGVVLRGTEGKRESQEGEGEIIKVRKGGKTETEGMGEVRQGRDR